MFEIINSLNDGIKYDQIYKWIQENQSLFLILFWGCVIAIFLLLYVFYTRVIKDRNNEERKKLQIVLKHFDARIIPTNKYKIATKGKGYCFLIFIIIELLVGFFFPASAIKNTLLTAMFFIAAAMMAMSDWIYVCPKCKKRKLISSTSLPAIYSVDTDKIQYTFACKNCGFAMVEDVFGD